MKNILPVLVLLSCLVGGAITTPQAIAGSAIASNWKKFDRSNYSIRYPANWDLEQKENTTGGTLLYPFAILSPLESPEDKFRENINLVIENLKGRTIEGVDGGTITLDRYVELSAEQLKLQMKNYKLVENKKIENGRRKYYRSIFTWDYETFRLKVEQYYWVVNGKGYVLTFTSEQSKFAKFRGLGEKILNTFTLRR